MSTKGSHTRSVNRDDKKLFRNWDEIDFSKKEQKPKTTETKLNGRTRIVYGQK